VRAFICLAACLAAAAADAAPARVAAVPAPRFMVLAFASAPAPGVPNAPAFQGVVSREVPREIGRRLDSLVPVETRFYAVRTLAGGRPRFVVSQRMPPAAQAILVAREGQARWVLDGAVRVTEKLWFKVRLQDVKSRRILLEKDYVAPTAKAGALLERAARDLAKRLPDGLGRRVDAAPHPAHEPGWDALLAYFEGEDIRFSRESGVGGEDLAAIFDRYLTACERDPRFDAARDALVAVTHQAIARGLGPVDAPLQALRRLAEVRPDSASRAALARGLARAGREREAEAVWLESVRKDPAFVEGWLNVAEARRRRGDYKGATTALEKAVALDLPTPRLRARAKSDLGALYLETGRVDRAIESLEASVKENPKDPDAYFRLGSAYEAKGKRDRTEARRWAAQAVEAFKTSDRLKGLPDLPIEPPGKERL
jgi:tetratricopeptide (TPR) repeat protein